jgi:hypothetical protein
MVNGSLRLDIEENLLEVVKTGLVWRFNELV